MRLHRLPIAVAPAPRETVLSYLSRLTSLHGLQLRELWEPISTPRPGSRRRDVVAGRLATVTGHDRDHLARALPELHPAQNWSALRHQPQPGCPPCDARHPGGPVTRLLPHQRYVCARHHYWLGPPDIDQTATALPDQLDDLVLAQRRHLRLLRRHGPIATYDAVLTAFLVCGHVWSDWLENDGGACREWDRRAGILIPRGREATAFSASRLFAVVYPEAVQLAALVASPAWRRLACGDADDQQRFTAEMGRRLGRPRYHPPEHGDAIAHWMKYDSWRPPSQPTTIFPDTQQNGSSHTPKTSVLSKERQARSALWFSRTRRGGGAILHHRHIQPVLGPTMVSADGRHEGDDLGQPHHRPESPGAGSPSDPAFSLAAPVWLGPGTPPVAASRSGCRCRPAPWRAAAPAARRVMGGSPRAAPPSRRGRPGPARQRPTAAPRRRSTRSSGTEPIWVSICLGRLCPFP